MAVSVGACAPSTARIGGDTYVVLRTSRGRRPTAPQPKPSWDDVSILPEAKSLLQQYGVGPATARRIQRRLRFEDVPDLFHLSPNLAAQLRLQRSQHEALLRFVQDKWHTGVSIPRIGLGSPRTPSTPSWDDVSIRPEAKLLLQQYGVGPATARRIQRRLRFEDIPDLLHLSPDLAAQLRLQRPEYEALLRFTQERWHTGAADPRPGFLASRAKCLQGMEHREDRVGPQLPPPGAQGVELGRRAGARQKQGNRGREYWGRGARGEEGPWAVDLGMGMVTNHGHGDARAHLGVGSVGGGWAGLKASGGRGAQGVKRGERVAPVGQQGRQDEAYQEDEDEWAQQEHEDWGRSDQAGEVVGGEGKEGRQERGGSQTHVEEGVGDEGLAGGEAGPGDLGETRKGGQEVEKGLLQGDKGEVGPQVGDLGKGVGRRSGGTADQGEDVVQQDDWNEPMEGFGQAVMRQGGGQEQGGREQQARECEAAPRTSRRRRGRSGGIEGSPGQQIEPWKYGSLDELEGPEVELSFGLELGREAREMGQEPSPLGGGEGGQEVRDAPPGRSPGEEHQEGGQKGAQQEHEGGQEGGRQQERKDQGQGGGEVQLPRSPPPQAVKGQREARGGEKTVGWRQPWQDSWAGASPQHFSTEQGDRSAAASGSQAYGDGEADTTDAGIGRGMRFNAPNGPSFGPDSGSGIVAPLHHRARILCAVHHQHQHRMRLQVLKAVAHTMVRHQGRYHAAVRAASGGAGVGSAGGM